MSETTTIRIREETRVALRRLEQLTGERPQDLIARAVEELRRTHQRALSRELVPAVYIEAMFKTTNDGDNRAAFAAAPADALDFVGIGVHGPRKTIDKVVNSLKFLA